MVSVSWVIRLAFILRFLCCKVSADQPFSPKVVRSQDDPGDQTDYLKNYVVNDRVLKYLNAQVNISFQFIQIFLM